MKGIKIVRRRNWQQHIRDNAYQADVLSDRNQQYWVEALSQPFAVQFTTAEETAIATATEALGEMCIEFLDWFFTDEASSEVDQRLASLKIPQAYWQALKNSWDRTDPVEDLYLCNRFDLALTDEGEVKLLEINAETPLLGAETVYQWNWFVDYRQNHQKSKYPLPNGSTQFNEYWELIAGQWRRIVADYELLKTGISFLVDEELEEDLEMASQLIQILHDEVDEKIYTQIVYLRGLNDDRGDEIQRGLGLDDDGYFIDHASDRISVLWKIYDWLDIENDMSNCGLTDILAHRLEQGDAKIIEPLWKQILANKGAMALMWAKFKDTKYGKYLLATYFEHDISAESTKLMLGMHVRKPIIGAEGVAVSIELGGSQLEKRDSLGYGTDGFIVQEYVKLPEAFGYHYMIGSWEVDGEAAGIILRGDKSLITGRNCLIIPHIIADHELAFN
ncbi:MAG: glutathionylspermidine synthase family protein [Cyanobacteria bacterium J06635_13]